MSSPTTATGLLGSTYLRKHHFRWWLQDEFEELLGSFGFTGMRSIGNEQRLGGRGQAHLNRRPRPMGKTAAMLDHLSIQCADVAASRAFYDTVLAPLGGSAVMDFGDVCGYGRERPMFWIGPVTTSGAAREVHIAFVAPDRAAVVAFHDAAVAHGAEVLHAPRFWPEYHQSYFGAFVRDPDGNNVEAVCHQPE